jgi:integrase/recombinase XerD
LAYQRVGDTQAIYSRSLKKVNNMGYDSHNYRRRLQLARQKIENDECISEPNRELIIKFLNFGEARGLSVSRLTKLGWTLRFWGRHFTTGFKSATKEDVIKAVSFLEGLPFKAHTKHDSKAILKLFWRWLYDCDSGECPKEIAWIKTTFRPPRLSPEDLLTKEEIGRILAAGRNPMEKAFVAILFETGARIGEMLSVRIKDISFDQLGSRLQVDGKVGQRMVRVITAHSYLTRWLDFHPHRDDPESSLWLNCHGKPMQNSTANLIVKQLAASVGINKRVYCYLYRHSGISASAPFLKEAVMKEVYGWTQSSRMPAVYIHLSASDIDSALLRMYGIAAKEEIPKQMMAKRSCPRCSLENPIADRFCGRCGMPLDPAEIAEMHRVDVAQVKADAILNQVLSDASIRDLLTRRVQEIASSQGLTKKSPKIEEEEPPLPAS